MQILDKYSRKIAWLITGILFAFAGACMVTSGSRSMEKFYNAGEVYDMPRSNLKQNWNTDLRYDTEQLVWEVQKDAVIKNIVISEGNWEYVYMYLSRLNRESFDATIICYDIYNNSVYSEEVNLWEGHNVLKIPNVKYTRMDIFIANQAGLTFDIEKMQFRETAPIFSTHNFTKVFFPLLAGFLLLTGGIGAVWKRKGKHIAGFAGLYGLQEVFMYVGSAGERLSQRYSEQIRSRIRTFLFAVLILGTQVAYVLRLHRTAFRYVELAAIGILCLIAFLCWEKPLKRLNWKNGLVASWTAVWTLSIISDFFVQKVYAYEGICMLFGMGFVFFMWGNMEHRERLLCEFLRGVTGSFWMIAAYCFLFRPYLPGYRYSGHNLGPNGFAMYVLFVFMAVLAQMHFDLQNKKVRRRELLYGIMLGICGCFLWKTQSVISLMLAVFVMLLFSLKVWMNKRKLGILGLVVYLCLVGIGYVGCDFCVYNVPRMLNLEIKYENDFYMDTVVEHPFLLDVGAAEPGNDNRLLYKLKTSTSLDELTTGRSKFWKAYLREMNLWGHRNKARFYGKTQDAHNGVLEFMYRYGIFAAVPYILMVLYSLAYAVQYFGRHWRADKYAFFVLLSALTCFGMLMLENIEIPFVRLNWYGLYFVLGVYFDNEKTMESK